ncbi:MAG: hypothetical protein U0521_06040 [Anaerolineae bacterium]
MCRLRPLLLILTLMISIGYFAHADDNTWTITERCFGDATQPPDDWSFDGTLLMTSEGRLHAFHQGWETPRIVVFSGSIPYTSIPHSGQLSPDGRWYAVITGMGFYSNFNNVVTWETETIQIYDTRTGEKHIIPWKGWFGTVSRLYGFGLYWLDNQHLLYERGEGQGGGWFVINPMTQAVAEWHSPLDLIYEIVYLAPDASAELHSNWGYGGYWTLSRGDYDIQLALWNGGVWRPDSQAFAAYTRVENEYRAEQLVVFDLAGNITDSLFDVPPEPQPNPDLLKWSTDARYLLFALDRLYIADMERQQIIDTCVPSNRVRSVAWSPDGTQFALLTSRRDDGIQIFDLQTWGRYVVGYHSGDLIGWRADD